MLYVHYIYIYENNRVKIKDRILGLHTTSFTDVIIQALLDKTDGGNQKKRKY